MEERVQLKDSSNNNIFPILGSPQELREFLAVPPNQNLLENPFFYKNSKGKRSYQISDVNSDFQEATCLDGWIMGDNTEVDVLSPFGISIRGGSIQTIVHSWVLFNTKLNFSIFCSYGTFSFSFDTTDLQEDESFLIKDSDSGKEASVTIHYSYIQNNTPILKISISPIQHLSIFSTKLELGEKSTLSFSEYNNELQNYPIGAIYMSTQPTSPASLFGGTWEQIKDTFLLAAGSKYEAGSIGGEASHKLKVSELPPHKHLLQQTSVNGTITSGAAVQSVTLSTSNKGMDSNRYDKGITNLDEQEAHNNMPPYLAVFMWKRIY